MISVGTVSGTVWTARSSMSFMLSKNIAKQLKLRDPSGGLTPMPKLVSAKFDWIITGIITEAKKKEKRQDLRDSVYDLRP
jgi:hypothetical protein